MDDNTDTSQEDGLEESWVKVLASLKDSPDKNQTPFSDFTEEEWDQLSKTMLDATTGVQDQRKGARRGACPYEGMSDEEWSEVWQTIKELKIGEPDRRKVDRRS